MIIKYFYDKKLAQASYLVGCGTSAMVIDPSRDITPYIQVAQAEGLDIKIVTETHIHADFVSGIRELAFATGAELYLSDMGAEDWKYQFTDNNIKLLKDGDSFKVSDITVDVIHTPGHTPEHIVFMIIDTVVTDEPVGIFSGDFIFA